jgi:hypothetical protein
MLNVTTKTARMCSIFLMVSLIIAQPSAYTLRQSAVVNLAKTHESEVLYDLGGLNCYFPQVTLVMSGK